MLSILAVAGTAALLAAAPAAVPAFSLTASPPAIHVSSGLWHSENIGITNAGGKPVRITVRLAPVGKVTGKCTAVPGTVTGVTLASPSFRLAAGQTSFERVTVAKTAPAQDLAVIFAAPPAQSGTARVGGEVGSQLAIGTAKVCGARPVAATETASGSPGPLVPVVLALAFCAAVGTLVITWIRRRRRPEGEEA